jgi:hypothetical protein
MRPQKLRIEETGVRVEVPALPRNHLVSIECRGLSTRITIPPKPFLVLLRMVTPIDHFPLILCPGGGLETGTWPYRNRKGSGDIVTAAPEFSKFNRLVS